MEKTMVLNLTLQEFKEARKIQVTMIYFITHGNIPQGKFWLFLSINRFKFVEHLKTLY